MSYLPLEPSKAAALESRNSRNSFPIQCLLMHFIQLFCGPKVPLQHHNQRGCYKTWKENVCASQKFHYENFMSQKHPKNIEASIARFCWHWTDASSIETEESSSDVFNNLNLIPKFQDDRSCSLWVMRSVKSQPNQQTKHIKQKFCTRAHTHSPGALITKLNWIVFNCFYSWFL